MTVNEIKECQDKNILHTERMNAQNRLRELDYIGTKIATGRATTEEYADQIAAMQEYADRINAIDSRVTELGNEDLLAQNEELTDR